MPEGYFNSEEAAERHKLASSRGGRRRSKKKGFAVSGKAAEAGRRSGLARRAASKEITILDPYRTQKAS